MAAQTDNLKWAYGTGDYAQSNPATGADGTAHAGSGDDYLYAIGG